MPTFLSRKTPNGEPARLTESPPIGLMLGVPVSVVVRPASYTLLAAVRPVRFKVAGVTSPVRLLCKVNPKAGLPSGSVKVAAKEPVKLHRLLCRRSWSRTAGRAAG